MMWLNEEMGMASCSATHPCIYCLIKLSKPEPGVAMRRLTEHAVMSSHSVIEGFLESYKCPCCSKDITGPMQHGPDIRHNTSDKQRRQAWARTHGSQNFMKHPLFYWLPVTRRIPDVLHSLLRVVEALFWLTAQKHAVDNNKV